MVLPGANRKTARSGSRRLAVGRRGAIGRDRTFASAALRLGAAARSPSVEFVGLSPTNSTLACISPQSCALRTPFGELRAPWRAFRPTRRRAPHDWLNAPPPPTAPPLPHPAQLACSPPHGRRVSRRRTRSPSTASVAPVTNALSSVARNSTARAISSARVAAERDHLLEDRRRPRRGLPRRGRLDPRCWNALSTGPGWIVLTRMPRSATSFAAVRISPTSACLDVA